MTQMFLIVKGNRSDAEEQGRERGLTLSIDIESAELDQTYCYCPMTDREKIIDWFYEIRKNGIAQKGACLWYNIMS